VTCYVLYTQEICYVLYTQEICYSYLSETEVGLVWTLYHPSVKQ